MWKLFAKIAAQRLKSTVGNKVEVMQRAEKGKIIMGTGRYWRNKIAKTINIIGKAYLFVGIGGSFVLASVFDDEAAIIAFVIGVITSIIIGINMIGKAELIEETSQARINTDKLIAIAKMKQNENQE